MTALVDTSVLVDVLRGDPSALRALRDARGDGLLHASEVTRLEVLAGMRASEEQATTALLEALTWHPLDEAVATAAGALGRKWLTSHGGIDAADLTIAATALALGARLLTKNVRHFPMFRDLIAPD